jgi:hypothetical protein
MLFNEIFENYYAQILSCFGLGASYKQVGRQTNKIKKWAEYVLNITWNLELDVTQCNNRQWLCLEVP